MKTHQDRPSVELLTVPNGAQFGAGFGYEGEGEGVAAESGVQEAGVDMEGFGEVPVARRGLEHSVPGF